MASLGELYYEAGIRADLGKLNELETRLSNLKDKNIKVELDVSNINFVKSLQESLGTVKNEFNNSVAGAKELKAAIADLNRNDGGTRFGALAEKQISGLLNKITELKSGLNSIGSLDKMNSEGIRAHLTAMKSRINTQIAELSSLKDVFVAISREGSLGKNQSSKMLEYVTGGKEGKLGINQFIEALRVLKAEYEQAFTGNRNSGGEQIKGFQAAMEKFNSTVNGTVDGFKSMENAEKAALSIMNRMGELAHGDLKVAFDGLLASMNRSFLGFDAKKIEIEIAKITPTEESIRYLADAITKGLKSQKISVDVGVGDVYQSAGGTSSGKKGRKSDEELWKDRKEAAKADQEFLDTWKRVNDEALSTSSKKNIYDDEINKIKEAREKLEELRNEHSITDPKTKKNAFEEYIKGETSSVKAHEKALEYVNKVENEAIKSWGDLVLSGKAKDLSSLGLTGELSAKVQEYIDGERKKQEEIRKTAEEKKKSTQAEKEASKASKKYRDEAYRQVQSAGTDIGIRDKAVAAAKELASVINNGGLNKDALQQTTEQMATRVQSTIKALDAIAGKEKDIRIAKLFSDISAKIANAQNELEKFNAAVQKGSFDKAKPMVMQSRTGINIGNIEQQLALAKELYSKYDIHQKNWDKAINTDALTPAKLNIQQATTAEEKLNAEIKQTEQSLNAAVSMAERLKNALTAKALPTNIPGIDSLTRAFRLYDKSSGREASERGGEIQTAFKDVHIGIATAREELEKLAKDASNAQYKEFLAPMIQQAVEMESRLAGIRQQIKSLKGLDDFNEKFKGNFRGLTDEIQTVFTRVNAMYNEFYANLGNRYSTGGKVFGAGTPQSDSIRALLSTGEFVSNADATKLAEPWLNFWNMLGGGKYEIEQVTKAMKTLISVFKGDDKIFDSLNSVFNVARNIPKGGLLPNSAVEELNKYAKNYVELIGAAATMKGIGLVSPNLSYPASVAIPSSAAAYDNTSLFSKQNKEAEEYKRLIEEIAKKEETLAKTASWKDTASNRGKINKLNAELETLHGKAKVYEDNDTQNAALKAYMEQVKSLRQSLVDLQSEYMKLQAARGGMLGSEFEAKADALAKQYGKTLDELIQKTSTLAERNKTLTASNAATQAERSAAVTELWKDRFQSVGKQSEGIKQLNDYFREIEKNSATIGSSVDKLVNKLARLKGFRDAQSLKGAKTENVDALISRYERWLSLINKIVKSGSSDKLAQLANLSPRLIARAGTSEGVAKDIDRQKQAVSMTSQLLSSSASAIHSNSNALKDMMNQTLSLNNQFQQLGMTIQNTFSILGLQQFAKQIIQVGGEIEKQKLAMGSIFGSEDKSEELYGKLSKLSMISPFDVEDVMKYSKQLAAFGIQYDDLYDTTKRLADVAAGVGVDFGRIAYEFGQTSARGWLDARELRMFANSGIPLLQKLSEYYSKVRGEKISASDVRSMISDREVSFDDVKKVMWQMTDEGGTFFQMQEVMAESLAAKWRNLGNAWNLMLADLAQNSKAGEWLKDLATVLTQLTQHWGSLTPYITLYSVAMVGAKVNTALSTVATEARTSAIFAEAAALKESAGAETIKKIAQEQGLAAGLAAAKTSKVLTGEEIKQAMSAGDLSKTQLILAARSGALGSQFNSLGKKAKMLALAHAGLNRSQIKTAMGGNILTASFMSLGQMFKQLGRWISANPWTILVTAIATVGAAIYNFVKDLNRLSDAYEELTKESNKELKKHESALDSFRKKLDDVNLSTEERQKLIDDFSSQYKDYLTDLDEEAIKQGNIAKAIDNVTESLKKNHETKLKDKKAEKAYEKYGDWLDYYGRSMLIVSKRCRPEVSAQNVVSEAIRLVEEGRFSAEEIAKKLNANYILSDLRNYIIQYSNLQDELNKIYNEQSTTEAQRALDIINADTEAQVKNAQGYKEAFEAQMKGLQTSIDVLTSTDGSWKFGEEEIKGFGNLYDENSEIVKKLQNQLDELKESYAEAWRTIAKTDFFNLSDVVRDNIDPKKTETRDAYLKRISDTYAKDKKNMAIWEKLSNGHADDSDLRADLKRATERADAIEAYFDKLGLDVRTYGQKGADDSEVADILKTELDIRKKMLALYKQYISQGYRDEDAQKKVFEVFKDSVEQFKRENGVGFKLTLDTTPAEEAVDKMSDSVYDSIVNAIFKTSDWSKEHKLTSPWGKRNVKGSPFHWANDFSAAVGTPIYSPVTGKVVSTGSSQKGGLDVVIQDAATNLFHHFLHLSKHAIKPGSVSAWQLIGYTGNTGVGTGPHLDWRVATTPWGVLNNEKNVTYFDPQTIGEKYKELGIIVDEGSQAVVEDVKTSTNALLDTLQGRINYVMSRLISEAGLTKEQAAGIVGNLIEESQINPKTHTEIKGVDDSYGIAQWNELFGNWSKATDWATKNGKNIETLEGQVDYLINGWQTAIKSINRIKNGGMSMDEAAFDWLHYVEVAKGYKDPNSPTALRRKKHAAEALSTFVQIDGVEYNENSIKEAADNIGELTSETFLSNWSKYGEILISKYDEAIAKETDKKRKERLIRERAEAQREFIGELPLEELKMIQEKQIQDAQKLIDDAKQKWDFFKQVRESTGDYNLAMMMSFDADAAKLNIEDGIDNLADWLQRELRAKLSSMVFDNDVIENNIDEFVYADDWTRYFAMDDNALRNEFGEQATELIKAYLKAWKDASESVKKEQRQTLLKLQKSFVDTFTKTQQIRFQFNKNKEAISMVKSPGERERLTNVADVLKEKALIEADSRYTRLLADAYSLTKKEAVEIGEKIYENLNKQLALGVITADEYAKKIKEIGDNITKVKTRKNVFSSIITGFFKKNGEGIAQVIANKANGYMAQGAALLDEANAMQKELADTKKGSEEYYKKSLQIAEKRNRAASLGQKAAKLWDSVNGDTALGFQDNSEIAAAALGYLGDMVDKAKEFAKTIGDEELANSLENISGVMQVLSATAQGGATGGWIGALVGFATSMIDALAESGFTEAAEIHETQKNISDLKRALSLQSLQIDEKKYDSIFGVDSLNRANEAYQKAHESLKAFLVYQKRYMRERPNLLEDSTTSERNGTSTNRKNAKNETSRIRNEFATLKEYQEQINNGWEELKKWKIKTIDRNWVGELFHSGDEYQEFGKLYGYLWDEDGGMNTEKLEAFLQTNTQISDEQRAQLQHLLDINKAYDEAIEIIDDLLNEWYGDWSTQITDAIFDSVINGADAWSKFEEAGADAVLSIGKTLMQTLFFQSYLDQFKEPLQEIFSIGDPEKQKEELLGITSEINNGLLNTVIPGAMQWANDYIEDAKDKGFVFDSSSSGLSSSIKGVTEETADILAAYLNAIRLDVSVQRTCVEDICYNQLPEFNAIAESQLQQLNMIAEHTRLTAEHTQICADYAEQTYEMLKSFSTGVNKVYIN